MKSYLISACLLCTLGTTLSTSAFPPKYADPKTYLKNLNQEWAKKSTAALLAKWDYEESLTKSALERMLKTTSDVARYRGQQRKEVFRHHREKIAEEDIRRQLELYLRKGPDGLSEEKYSRFQMYVAELGVAPHCSFQGCTSTDGNVAGAEERFECWRAHLYGLRARKAFGEILKLAVDIAQADNLSDVSGVLFRDLQWPDGKGGNSAESQAEFVATNLAPLYEQLHKYWRSRLHAYYREASPPDQPILDHLREAPVCDADPIPNKPLDLSGAMRSKAFTKRRLVEMAAEFFSSLNMSTIPDSLWSKSSLEKEPNRTIPCHSMAVDFLDNKDYRIRLCGQLDGKTMVTAAVLVGRVVASMELRPLVSIYRTPDPVAADAAGLVAALSLLSPSQLRQAGLLAGDDSAETSVNVLHQVARAVLAPALHSLSADLWRIRAFRSGPKSALNSLWWKLRLKYEGVQPPINRTEKDFDAASVPPVLADPMATPLRSTLGMALGFQLHKILCQQADQFDPQEPERMPLHQCNLYGSPIASKALKNLLKFGLSKEWPTALKAALTASATPATVDETATLASAPLTADPILEYFQPLKTWLADNLGPAGETLSFGAPDFACPQCQRVLSNKEAKSPSANVQVCNDGGEDDLTTDLDEDSTSTSTSTPLSSSNGAPVEPVTPATSSVAG